MMGFHVEPWTFYIVIGVVAGFVALFVKHASDDATDDGDPVRVVVRLREPSDPE